MDSEEINYNDGYWLQSDSDHEFDSPALDLGEGAAATSLASSMPSLSLGYPSFSVDEPRDPPAGIAELQEVEKGPSRKELLAKALEENRKYRKHLEAILEKVSIGLENNQVEPTGCSLAFMVGSLPLAFFWSFTLLITLS